MQYRSLRASDYDCDPSAGSVFRVVALVAAGLMVAILASASWILATVVGMGLLGAWMGIGKVMRNLRLDVGRDGLIVCNGLRAEMVPYTSIERLVTSRHLVIIDRSGRSRSALAIAASREDTIRHGGTSFPLRVARVVLETARTADPSSAIEVVEMSPGLGDRQRRAL